MKKDTLCVHNRYRDVQEHHKGALAVPIYQSASYAHPGVGQSTGFDYTRESNPTRKELEETVNNLEGAYDTIACSSGMAAMSIALEMLELGSHIICSEDLYGGSVRLFANIGEAKRGMRFSYVNTGDIEAVRKEICKETKVLYIETPSNPMMQITDLRAIRDLADEYGLMVIVDNTFLTPYFQKPFTFGADMVIHSGTKYLGGHNDTLAGFLSVANEELAQRMRYLYKTIGPCLSPFDSYLMIRGIKTLGVRLEKQEANAKRLALWLKNHEKVEKVYYVGLEDHPGYAVNQAQASGCGAMISFRTKKAETAKKLLERVKIISYAESLGGVESLITYPMLQTHADLSPEVKEKLGITDTLIRFSVGIENVEDLIEDLSQAMGD